MAARLPQAWGTVRLNARRLRQTSACCRFPARRPDFLRVDARGRQPDASSLHHVWRNVRRLHLVGHPDEVLGLLPPQDRVERLTWPSLAHHSALTQTITDPSTPTSLSADALDLASPGAARWWTSARVLRTLHVAVVRGGARFAGFPSLTTFETGPTMR